MQTLGLFAFAFLGGVILNVMPCVLPVLALKAFSVLDHARAEPRLQRLHGAAYSAGTISALALFGGAVVVLRGLGKLFGWGMQFQHPVFVAALTAVVFAFALNALGVFELTIGVQQHEHEGLWGSVANGWLAAVMATPCSAPFLGTAAAFAMASDTPAWKTLTIFVLVGAGLAFPFALLTWVPALGRRLPRPGRWMESVKMIMGFTLLGTAVWLYRVLLQQVTPDSAAAFLGFLVVLAAGLWAQQRWAGLAASTAQRWVVRVVVISVVVLGGSFVSFQKPAPVIPIASADPQAKPTTPAADDHIAWVPFQADSVQAMVNSGKPVFLDFTAEWCASCKANEKIVLETPAVRTALKNTGVVPVKVDMTNQDDTKDEWLTKAGRNGIPTYVLLTKSGMEVLPIVVTVDTVVSALERASHKVKGG